MLAESCKVAPAASRGASGAIVTRAIAAWTMISDPSPTLPSTEATSVVLPGAIAVTTPLALTVATPGDVVLHVGVPMRTAARFWSSPSALTVAVSPTASVSRMSETFTAASTGAAVGGPVTPLAAPPPQPAALSERITSAARAGGLMSRT